MNPVAQRVPTLGIYPWERAHVFPKDMLKNVRSTAHCHRLLGTAQMLINGKMNKEAHGTSGEGTYTAMGVNELQLRTIGKKRPRIMLSKRS